jgi:outer membrane protein OmpA-like peptidoglycan-associated protein
MYSVKVNIFCLIIALFLAGCSSHRSLIVLLPEADGSVGSIEVKSKLGSKVLNKPFYATRVDNMYIPPTEPEPMEKNEILDVFGDALSAQSKVQFVPFTLYFHSGTAKLTEKSRNLLPSIVTAVKNRNLIKIFVAGHADRVGTEQFNLNLSSKRAKCIKNFLIDSGIKSDLIVDSYYGEKNPLILTEDEVAEPMNRRVEVIVQ